MSEQNFTEGNALVQCYALCKIEFMIKNFEKATQVMVLNFLNLVLKRY